MLEMIDELLENSLLGAVLFGIAVAVSIATGTMALVCLILAFSSAWWWLIGLLLFTIISGASTGLSIYLSNELYC